MVSTHVSLVGAARSACLTSRASGCVSGLVSYSVGADICARKPSTSKDAPKNARSKARAAGAAGAAGESALALSKSGDSAQDTQRPGAVADVGNLVGRNDRILDSTMKSIPAIFLPSRKGKNIKVNEPLMEGAARIPQLEDVSPGAVGSHDGGSDSGEPNFVSQKASQIAPQTITELCIPAHINGNLETDEDKGVYVPKDNITEPAVAHKAADFSEIEAGDLFLFTV